MTASHHHELRRANRLPAPSFRFTVGFVMIAIVSLLAFVLIDHLGRNGSGQGGIPADLEALLVPGEPIPLTAAISEGHIEISWRANGESIHHYVVYRRLAAGGPWVKLDTVAATIRNANYRDVFRYLDPSASSGTTYLYGVTAVAINFALATPGPGLESHVAESNTITAP
jgi:hypothetical protein